MEMIRESPLGYFFHADERVRFSGLLLHFLLLHQVESPYQDELRFMFGDVQTQFGRVEFGLITGLSFGPLPTESEREEYMSMTGLQDRHFTPVSSFTVKELGSAFDRCTDGGDVLRLGLCYLMHAYLFGCEQSNKIWLDCLHMADDPQRFLSYPWGHECFSRFMDGVHKKDLAKIGKGDVGQAKYTVTGYCFNPLSSTMA